MFISLWFIMKLNFTETDSESNWMELIEVEAQLYLCSFLWHEKKLKRSKNLEKIKFNKRGIELSFFDIFQMQLNLHEDRKRKF